MSEPRFFFFRSLDCPQKKQAVNLQHVVGYSISAIRGENVALLQISFEKVTRAFEVYMDVALKFRMAMEEYHEGEVL